ncbi:MAG: hypothetical protein K0Q72_1028, partial [Armatimonadetes bacterium]|nr:hypothetical protein [Armatimonadota bacterium]
MAELLALLAELQQRIAQQGFPELLPGDRERILFTEEHGGLCVEFYGDPLGESFPELLGTLSRPEVASRLDYLVLRGPDEGANGTRNWDLTAFLESETEFPRLRALFLQPSGPEWHNRSIVAAEYDEAGMLGQVLDRAPVLGALTA